MTNREVLGFAHHSLAAYSIAMNERYMVAPHHRLIAKKLEAIARGDLKRLMIFVPPRHGKSMLASENFSAWYLGHHPDHYIIAATYAQELADDFGRKVRNQLRDPLYQAIFPGTQLMGDSTSAKRFNTGAGGAYFAVGIGGPITGRGAHVLLIDDPVKNQEEADSETIRRKHKEWYSSVAYTRLMPGGAIVVIQTRWHEDDLSGWLLREHAHEGWDVVNLPALDDQGQALWPEQFGGDRLREIQLSIGPRAWEALYQQRPTSAEGLMLKRDWWRTYTVPPASFEYMIQSWDCSFKGSDGSDHVVGQVWGRIGGKFYLLHQVRQRMGFSATKAAILNVCRLFPEARAVFIEDAANGTAIIEELSAEIPGVMAVKPLGGKVARAQAAQPYLEAGNCYLPAHDALTPAFIEEAAAFPRGKHDDMVDAWSQAMAQLGRYEEFEPLGVNFGEAFDDFDWDY